MKAFAYRTAIARILIATLLPATVAHAQLWDLLRHGADSAGSSREAWGNMGSGLSGPSFVSGSVGNVAGLLEFCIGNRYLEESDAATVREKLMGNFSDGLSSSHDDYKNGAKGLLTSKNGQQLNLSSGGLNAEATKQVCDNILAQGKSML